MSELRRAFPALGTFVELTLRSSRLSEDELIDLSILGQQQIAEVQARMSFHDEASELSALNREAYCRAVEVSEGMMEVLTLAKDLSRRSQGCFDLTIAPTLERRDVLPRIEGEVDSSANWEDVVMEGQKVLFRKKLRLDLGGIAKGWAVDRAVEVLTDQDAQVVVNAGGDLRMTDWKGEEALIRESGQRIPMQAAALATSSSQNFDEGNDLVEPNSGDIRLSPAPVSVFAPTCILADALTKVATLHPAPQAILAHYGATLVG